MSWLVDLDTALLRLLNVQWTNPFLDRVIPLFSHFDLWKIPLIVLLIVMVVRERLKGVIIVIGLGLTILLSESMCTIVVKELIDRIRPCHIHAWVRLIEGYCPKSPAFPSSHATNITAAITFLSFFFPRWLFVMVPLALLVGYSRVYLGVHYPFDVVGGAILGAGCGWAVFVVFKKFVFPRLGIELNTAGVKSNKKSSVKRRRSA
ncbi:MAG: phosphatase PAP2 family protein [Desulfobacterales bacterium]|nr:phosphatase PAP2 family protein [Desulfobacterales bacterium]